MRRVIPILLSAAGLLSGCAPVPFYRKQELGRRVMQMDDAPLETLFQNKIYLSRGVSGGRPGLSAGGGCGCSN